MGPFTPRSRENSLDINSASSSASRWGSTLSAIRGTEQVVELIQTSLRHLPIRAEDPSVPRQQDAILTQIGPDHPDVSGTPEHYRQQSAHPLSVRLRETRQQ